MHIDKRSRDYYIKYYQGLVGGKITLAGVGDDGFPFFNLSKDGKTFRVEISQDPEGNGPGFLFGLPEAK